MTDAHASSSDLESYVRGALGPSRARAVEAHCASCGGCGEALRREAAVEMAMYEVAARRHAGARRRGVPGAAMRAVGVALAVAAAAVLMLSPSSAAHRDDDAATDRASPTPPAFCADGSPCGSVLASRSIDATWQSD